MDSTNKIRGINVKANHQGRLRLGLHKDSLIAELHAIPANDRGYINLDLIPNHKPTDKGYTHRVVLITDDIKLQADSGA